MPRFASELTTDDELRATLQHAKTIAVLGAHNALARPACYVPSYLQAKGYRVIPVNPKFAGDQLWDETVRASLADIAEPVDIVDIFRPGSALPDHLPDILAMQPPASVVWFQLGVRNDDVARALIEAGIDVVQDHCTMAEHRKLGLG